MTARGPQRTALERALAAAGLKAGARDKRDDGALELARAYADALDAAGELAAAALAVVRDCAANDDPIGAAHARKLADALAARQALADLGPKYQQCLAALHLTTAARMQGKEGQRDDVADPTAIAEGELGQRARQRHAAAVDPAAPPAHP